jgi:hypothetical protein
VLHALRRDRDDGRGLGPRRVPRRWESRGAVSLDDQFWESAEMVSPAENAELVAPFLE